MIMTVIAEGVLKNYQGIKLAEFLGGLLNEMTRRGQCAEPSHGLDDMKVFLGSLSDLTTMLFVQADKETRNR